jgi:phosphoribosylamine--glycine ligase
MKTLVIGNGGREHALAAGLARDPGVSAVHAAPGNPGMAAVATLHPVDPLDPSAVVALAEQLKADLVVVGPEAPLVAGVADALRARGFAVFGPDRAAARIEGSKAFAKEVMAAAGIPTAMAHVCESPGEVEVALDAFGPPYVVKDDGLAAGKGVVVTDDRVAAVAHASACGRVVIEEYLAGPEVSLFALCDGVDVLPMQPAQDFKRLLDDDQGPNTGGMGAYTPLPWAPADLVDDVRARVLQPAVDELARRGTPFVGLLYAGLALTSRGVRVIEFNARFGDPETQPLLELLDSPLGAALHAAATGRLAEHGELLWKPGAAVAVVMASAGYPEAPRKGDRILGIEAAEALEGVVVRQAGTAPAAQSDGRAGAAPADGSAGTDIVTNGGRVVAVTAVADTLATARDAAYAGVAKISWDGAQYRRDIAKAAADSTATPPTS